MKKSQKIIVLSGEGGHSAQAAKFISNVQALGHVVIWLREKEEFSVPKISWLTKDSKVTLALAGLVCVLWFPIALIRWWSDDELRSADLVVSFGPMCTIPHWVAARSFGRNFVYVESWSRFEKSSLTGRFQLLMGSQYVTQNPMQHEDKLYLHFGRLG